MEFGDSDLGFDFWYLMVRIDAENIATNSFASFSSKFNSDLSQEISNSFINSSQNNVSSASSSTIFNLFKKSASDFPLHNAL